MIVIFNTKMVKEENRNGQKVEILKKHDNGYRYLIRFSDGYKIWAYSSELDFEY